MLSLLHATGLRPLGVRLVLALVLCAGVVGLDVWRRGDAPAPAQAALPEASLALAPPDAPSSVLDSASDPASIAPSPTLSVPWQRVAHGPVPMPEGTAAAHASSLQVMPASSPALLTLFWFSGERESGPRVQIAASQLDRRTHTWAPPRFVVNRHTLGAQLGFGVRRLGNPVVWMDAQGRMHLFVVATGGGGWAASRVVHLQQSSTSQALADLAFEPVGVLPLSWLWNTSMLVRNAPLPLADGGMVLPVHFELGLKYPLALRFDAQGQFLGMVRMSQRTHALQPALLALSAQSWVALMRDERSAGKVLAARTTDGGQHWQDLPDLALVNPDAAVAGLTLAGGQQLLAHNSSPGTRATLDLSHSTDGLQWQRVGTIEQGAQADEFSYPAMAWADGSLWIAYTVDRQRIAWQQWKPGGAP
jgi:BNR repeat-like domain